jgi:hypothetical protein
MLIIGCDYHPAFQQIAFVDTETGECGERRLTQREEAEQFYQDLKQAKCVATGSNSLADVRTYEVEFESKKYQVEVQILENTDGYVHVGIAVDNGHFWRAMCPLSSSFICRKDGWE